jgi:hypothetical protein
MDTMTRRKHPKRTPERGRRLPRRVPSRSSRFPGGYYKAVNGDQERKELCGCGRRDFIFDSTESYCVLGTATIIFKRCRQIDHTVSTMVASAGERSPLLPSGSDLENLAVTLSWRRCCVIGLALLVALAGVALAGVVRRVRKTDNTLFCESLPSPTLSSSTSTSCSFPSNFIWGTATSSYQIEGAASSRGATIWDEFIRADPRRILDHSTADIACDHVHRYKDDVQLMKTLNIRAYRFSIAWARILPTGEGAVNLEGIQFYNELIDELIRQDIQPWITLFHWDLPMALEEKYGGWLNESMSDVFVDYVRVVFAEFGDRVKHWITINEYVY